MRSSSESAADAERSELFSLLRSHGALKRAYVPLRQALPSVLARSADAHALVISAVEALLGGSVATDDPNWPGSSAAAYCSLLIDAAGKLELTPSTSAVASATALCHAHPSFFRKLSAVYGGGRNAALVAARALLSRGDAAEVCNLVAEFGLTDAGFDVGSLLAAAIDENKAHAAACLGAASPEYGVLLLEAYIAKRKEREGMRLIPRLNLRTSDLPRPLVRQLRIGLLAPRLRWLARSHYWDLIDVAFHNLAHAANAADVAAAATAAIAATAEGIAVEPCAESLDDLGMSAGAPDGEDARGVRLVDAAAVDDLVLNTALDGSEWLALAALLARRLISLGLRGAAVRGCVRHRIHTRGELV